MGIAKGDMVRVGHLLIFAAGLVVATASARAETAFIPKTQGVGVEAQMAETETELLKGALARNGFSSAASAEQADVEFKSKIIKLGNSYILQVDKIVKGSLKFSTELKAAGVDELDKVTDRIVRAAIHEQASKQDARVDEVTDTEAYGSQTRLAPVKHWQLAFGPSWGTNLGSPGTMSNFKLGYAWEAKNVELSLFLRLLTGLGSSDSGMSMVGIGGKYYFDKDSNSPFVSGGFGFGSSGLGDKLVGGQYVDTSSGTGFAWAAGGGYSILRTSSVNLDLSADFFGVFRKNIVGVPFAFGLGLGLNF